MIVGFVNLVVFGTLAYFWWDAPDRFMAGMFFTLATYPIFLSVLDALWRRIG